MEPIFPEELVDEIEMMKQWSGASSEMATAFILQKYNAGVSLFKSNGAGDFKKLRTTETVDSDGNKFYQSNNCP